MHRVGCIAGVVWMIQGKPKGLKMVGLSIVADIVKSVIVAIFYGGRMEGGPERGDEIGFHASYDLLSISPD